MGSCCSKSSSNFDGPGRQLGSTPSAPPDRSSVPANASKPKISGSGRTLGSSTDSGDVEGPRAAAARAAEARAAKAQPKGKLGEQLAAQKSQTQNSALKAASEQERGARLQDENAATRAWN